MSRVVGTTCFMERSEEWLMFEKFYDNKTHV
jgi:hypothetical protein